MWKTLNEILIKENDGKKFKCNYDESFEYIVKFDKEKNTVCLHNKKNNEKMTINNVILNWKYEEIIESHDEWVNEMSQKNVYSITHDGYVISHLSPYSSLIKSFNCFKTKEKAHEVAKEQLLYRFMKKFRDENDEKVDWMREYKKGYFIYKNINNGQYEIDCYRNSRDLHTIYFTSQDLAQQCLNEMKKQGYI